MADAGRRCEPFAHGLDGLRGQVARPGAGALGALLDGLGAMGLGVYVVGADYAVQYQNGIQPQRASSRGWTCAKVTGRIDGLARPALHGQSARANPTSGTSTARL